ncbi:MAG: TetR/AcrR family transcriptional regulator [Deltaproteobacteria bacterium]|nr:TetR/AcrR family transcriptional regulator [Deltaproteobacteria bacterium]
MPKKVNKTEKMKAIADVSITVFKTHGFHDTRMADIAQAAKIGKGTIYEYFKNKADILRYALNQYFHAFTLGAMQTMEDVTEPLEKLLSLIEFAFRHAAAWEDHCTVYVDYFGTARREQEFRIYLDGIYTDMEFILESIIKEGQQAGKFDMAFDSAAVAVLLVSLYEGVILYDVFKGKPGNRKIIRDAAVRLIARGLKSDRPEK